MSCCLQRLSNLVNIHVHVYIYVDKYKNNLLFFGTRFYRYASESIRLACKFAYRNATPGSTLTDDYFLSRRPVVEKRLVQSGFRLAEVLNRIFTNKTSVAAQ